MDVPVDLLETIKNSKNILIQTHQKPDGDAIGSLVSLGKGLKKLGKNVDYWVDTTYEPKLNIFPEMELFNQNIKNHYDSLIIVDCSTKDFSASPITEPSFDNLIVIDHHQSNKKYGDYNFVYETGATGELIYQTLEALGVELDDEMRQAIFTALTTDTGSFQFSNTNKQTHEIAAKLYTPDINFAPISKRLHKEKTYEQLKLYAKAIENLELFHNGELVILDLPYETIQQFGGIQNVTDDLANIGMDIDSSKLSVFIKEVEPNEFKMSLRSKSPYDIDVSTIATERGGGGHFRASGFSASGDIKHIKSQLVDELENLL